jgi:hypothetical protein
MAEAVYALCGITSLLCAALLLRGYRRSRFRLLLWSGLCFAGLTINSVFLFLDKVTFPEIDLHLWRQGTALLALVPMLYGMICDADGTAQ